MATAQLWHEIRNESARLIQIEWRRYKFETKYEYAEDDDPEYEQGIAYLEKLEDRQIRLLRELKRQRARIRLVDDPALQNPPITVVCFLPLAPGALALPLTHSPQHLCSGACGDQYPTAIYTRHPQASPHSRPPAKPQTQTLLPPRQWKTSAS